MPYWLTHALPGGAGDLRARVRVPPGYRRGHGLPCVLVLSDLGEGPAAKARRDDWEAVSVNASAVIFFFDPPESGWRAEHAEPLFHAYTALCNWWEGGYSILSAFRCLAAHGAACAAGDAFCRGYGRQLAAAALLEPGGFPANPPAPAQALPLWVVHGGGFDNDPAAAWLQSWLRVNGADRRRVEGSDVHWENSANAAAAIRLSGASAPAPDAAEVHRFLISRRRWGLSPEYGLIAPAREPERLERVVVAAAGIEREYYLSHPEKTAEKPVPLVVAMHGITSNGLAFLEQTGWDRVGREHGFAVLSPTGFHNRWNVARSPDYPDDCGFIMTAISELAAKGTIDPSRVYAHGFSMGGAMVNRLMCSFPYAFAAGAAFSGHLFEDFDDDIVIRSDADCGGGAYVGERSDIPRPMRQYYGEAERFSDYPGNREVSNRFWRASAGAENTDAAVRREPGGYAGYRIEEWAGVFFPYQSICETGLSHAYHPDEFESLYTRFFSRHRRPKNSVAEASAIREKGGVRVRWRCSDHPRHMLVLSEDGFSFPRLAAAGETGEMLAAIPESVSALHLLPVHTEGAASAPYVVAVK